MMQDFLLLPIDALFVGGWIVPALGVAAGLWQGLSGKKTEDRNRQFSREQLDENRRQFDASHRLNQDRHGLDQRQVALQEGVDRRRSSGLEATSGSRQRLIANLLQRLLGQTGGPV